MIRLEMTENEARVVQTVLENYRGHLEVEIHRTEKKEFREALEKRNEFLLNILQRLSAVGPGPQEQ